MSSSVSGASLLVWMIVSLRIVIKAVIIMAVIVFDEDQRIGAFDDNGIQWQDDLIVPPLLRNSQVHALPRLKTPMDKRTAFFVA